MIAVYGSDVSVFECHLVHIPLNSKQNAMTFNSRLKEKSASGMLNGRAGPATSSESGQLSSVNNYYPTH